MNVLLVDDNQTIWDYYTKVIREEFGDDIHLTGCLNGKAMKAVLSREDIDIVIIDQRLADGEKGIDLIPTVRKINPSAKIIINSGYGGEELAVESMRKGADDYVQGNKERDDLFIEAIHRVTSGIKTERKISSLIRESERKITGLENSCDEKMAQLRERVKKMSVAVGCF